MKFIDTLEKMGVDVKTRQTTNYGKQEINFKDLIVGAIEDLLNHPGHFIKHLESLGIELDISTIDIKFPEKIESTFDELIEAYLKDTGNIL